MVSIWGIPKWSGLFINGDVSLVAMSTPKQEKGRRALPCCKLNLPRRKRNQQLIPNNCGTGDQISNSEEQAVHWSQSVHLLSVYPIYAPRICTVYDCRGRVARFLYFTVFGCKLRGIKLSAKEVIRADLTNWSDSLVFCRILFLWLQSPYNKRHSCCVCHDAYFLLFS